MNPREKVQLMEMAMLLLAAACIAFGAYAGFKRRFDEGAFWLSFATALLVMFS